MVAQVASVSDPNQSFEYKNRRLKEKFSVFT